MFGLLNLNKPVGWTSRDAINRVQGRVRPAKVGHAGTLDPLASGVLVVCIGQATRLIEYVQRMPKEYEATFLLGRTSPSDDVETPCTELTGESTPTQAQIEEWLPHFTGEILQRPPAYSALKVAGQRAYKLARRGESPDLAPRTVTIHSLAVTGYAYPRLDLLIRCSSGTYVRALGRDLAESLGTGAVMSALIRTAVGSFCIESAASPDELDGDSMHARLQSPLAAVADLPFVRLTAAQIAAIAAGKLLPTGELANAPVGSATRELAAVDDRSRLIAILKLAAAGLWKPSPNFSQSE